MAMRRVSVAEAKNKFILSHEGFERLRSAAAGQGSAWAGIQAWREKYASSVADLDVAGALSGERHQRAPRRVKRR
jgi:hypothetical protein